jgi:hypothetical protein
VRPQTLSPGEPLPFEQIGYNKFAFEVGNLQQERTRLERDGIEFLSATSEENGILEAYARDPDGNLFSLLQTAPTSEVKVSDLLQIDWLPSPASPLIR